MTTYRWSSAQEWLEEKLEKLAEAGDIKELAGIANALMYKVEGDDIQDIFQSEMEEDGYFKPDDEEAEQEFRDRIENWLEEQSDYKFFPSEDQENPDYDKLDEYLCYERGDSFKNLYESHDGDADEAIRWLS
jgi:hypothetical protein